MYKDEIWYRKLETAINEHHENLTPKQWTKYKIDYLLKIARHVADHSEGCETCRGFQHTLTRLEEEMQELPSSKAQRQYQVRTLVGISEHFVKAHRMVPPGYYLWKWLRYGLIAGLLIGLIVSVFVTGNPLHFLLGGLIGAGLLALYGYSEDNRVKQEHRQLM